MSEEEEMTFDEDYIDAWNDDDDSQESDNSGQESSDESQEDESQEDGNDQNEQSEDDSKEDESKDEKESDSDSDDSSNDDDSESDDDDDDTLFDDLDDESDSGKSEESGKSDREKELEAEIERLKAGQSKDDDSSDDDKEEDPADSLKSLDDLAEDFTDEEKADWQEIANDFPVIKKMMEKINENAQAKVAENNTATKQEAAKSAEEQRKIDNARFNVELLAKRPDYQEVILSKSFEKWAAKQGEGLSDLMNSNNIDDALKVLTAFDSAKAAAKAKRAELKAKAEKKASQKEEKTDTSQKSTKKPSSGQILDQNDYDREHREAWDDIDENDL